MRGERLTASWSANFKGSSEASQSHFTLVTKSHGPWKHPDKPNTQKVQKAHTKGGDTLTSHLPPHALTVLVMFSCHFHGNFLPVGLVVGRGRRWRQTDSHSQDGADLLTQHNCDFSWSCDRRAGRWTSDIHKLHGRDTEGFPLRADVPLFTGWMDPWTSARASHPRSLVTPAEKNVALFPKKEWTQSKYFNQAHRALLYNNVITKKNWKKNTYFVKN